MPFLALMFLKAASSGAATTPPALQYIRRQVGAVLIADLPNITDKSPPRDKYYGGETDEYHNDVLAL
jgi:hypothetical protein